MKFKKNFLKILLLFFIPFIYQHAAAKTSNLNPAKELIGLLNNTRSMQATFVQQQINSKKESIGGATAGTMALERPGKFRWKIKKPFEQLILVNEDKTSMYDSDLEQLTIRKIDTNNHSNPAMLLSQSPTKLTAQFNIAKLLTSNKEVIFQLKPKISSQNNGYQSIVLRFADGKISGIEILDTLEQKTEIKFNNIKFNLKIPPKMFVFTPPPGTDVFEAN